MTRFDKLLISFKEMEIRELKLNAEERLQRLEKFMNAVRDGEYAFYPLTKKNGKLANKDKRRRVQGH